MAILNAEPSGTDAAIAPSRRTALKVAGGLSLAGVLAACTSGSGSSAHSSASTSAPTSPSAATSPAGPPDWAALAAQLRRPLLQPGGAGFADGWRLYNPRFDSLPPPAAVAQPTTTAEVASCVQFAARSHLPLAVRAGGHSYGGWSTGTGLVIDLRQLATVQVNATAGTATIGAGAALVDVYSALAAQNVAIGAGSCPTVGLTGLALGGGVGVLTRAFGLTCDQVRSIDIVTADGQGRTVDATHDPDLFWALRGGGGGSFGAVTALTLAVRPAPTITTFYYEFAFAQAAAVLTAWLAWIPGADASLWSTCKLLGDPGKGQLQATVSGTWLGAASALPAQLAGLLNQLPVPSSRSINTSDYGSTMLGEAGCSGQTPAQCTAAALTAPGRQPFSATSSIVGGSLPAAAIAAAVAQTQQAMAVPGLVEGGVSFDALGGAVASVAAEATPFPYRQAIASVQYTATWGATAPADAAAAAPFDAYVRGFRAAMAPWLGAAAYVNYADPSITDYGAAYWGSNYARLQQVKAKYDPQNVFTFAQAVKA